MRNNGLKFILAHKQFRGTSFTDVKWYDKDKTLFTKCCDGNPAQINHDSGFCHYLHEIFAVLGCYEM
jgi:hypothetical protein